MHYSLTAAILHLDWVSVDPQIKSEWKNTFGGSSEPEALPSEYDPRNDVTYDKVMYLVAWLSSAAHLYYVSRLRTGFVLLTARPGWKAESGTAISYITVCAVSVRAGEGG